ncbi:MAG: histidine phosphatase family protein [Eubacteriales bacterium]|nr:histidine phosphatase family protein [Eubacteriales bacterium]
MKLLIIRHADPDYEIDSLTEKGWHEAELLSEKIGSMKIDKVYVSPYGRAKDTASLSLKKLNQSAEECDWLREFEAPIRRPDITDRKIIPWDWLPQDWTQDERFYHYDQWFMNERMAEGRVKEEYDRVTEAFDAVLAMHGYSRDGHIYRAQKPNNDTIAFFCHFGLGSVLISHLLSVSPMIFWHGTCAAPSSVTTLVTEERREGIAQFRMTSFGDTGHLFANNEPPAFAARFCECYDNQDERHD